MGKHFYLNQLWVDDHEYSLPDNVNISAKEEYRKPGRIKRLNKQKRKYGFSEEEVWNMDMTSAMWLYEHLMMYKETNNVNLDFYKFNVPVLYEDKDHDKKVEERDKYNPTSIEYIPYMKTVTESHTEGECINLCIEYLKDYIYKSYNPDYNLNTQDSIKEDCIINEELKCAFHIYAEIISYVWW